MKNIRQFINERQTQFGEEADQNLEAYHRRLGALDLINILNTYLDSEDEAPAVAKDDKE